jgi:AcrR family transcriptional regulator
MTTESPRAVARAETIEQIKSIARRHLAVDGANLSLRAVARDLGVVSSAVYRYFASRDDLLTALIIDGYLSMAEAVEQAEATVPRRDVVKRWDTVCRTVRTWSREHPDEFGLLYGTPVPGYAAPQDTTDSAQRVLMLALEVLRDGVEREVIPVPSDRLPRSTRAELTAILALPGLPRLPVTLLARAMGVWAQLFGLISFELFGRYRNGIDDWDAFFDVQLGAMARQLGVR